MAQESWKREEDAGCQAPEGPILCTNNCGFYGSVTTMNMCSKCYRDFILKQSKSPTLSAIDMSSLKSLQDRQPRVEIETKLEITVETTAEVPKAAESSPSPSLEESTVSSSTAGGGQRLPNRCFACRKRVGLTGFKCRCGDIFCNLHRYSDKHSCTFDYKAAGREAIAKANPVVKADKVEKI